MKNLGRKIGGLGLTIAFVFGISAASSFTANAQYRHQRNGTSNNGIGNILGDNGIGAILGGILGRP